MTILISGASGLIGSALYSALTSRGHVVRRLVRAPVPRDTRDIFWNPPLQAPSPADLEGTEVIIHLAGESIASGRWTPARKRAILDSRLQSTEILTRVVSQMSVPPRVVVSASAIGYYGNRGEDWVDEKSDAGDGFLADVCRQWEKAGSGMSARGTRVAFLRTGIVLNAEGGALAKMLPPFHWGLGGRLGGGGQWMSWITLEDVIAAILFILESASVSGPINAVGPAPVTNQEFTTTLGRSLKRPTLFSVPAPALRLVLGEMAEELLLASTRVRPSILLANQFRFRFPDLAPALRHILAQ